MNQQLGNAKGLVGVTITGLTSVSNLLSTARNTLVTLADGNTTGAQRTEAIQSYKQTLVSIKSAIQDSGYNGKTLIGNITGSAGTFAKATLIRNDQGSTYGVATFGGSAFFGSLSFTATQLGGAATVAGLITTGGVLLKKVDQLGQQLNSYGAASNFIDNQTTFNSNKIDSLNSGLGSLIDADLTKEAARLQSLQIKQQLGTQALSIANQAPSSLLSLFK